METVTNHRWKTTALCATLGALTLFAAGPAAAGGASVPEVGDGWVSVGYNRKTGDRRLDADGENFIPGGGRTHIFEYGYFSGEAGVLPDLAVNWTLTYLWGQETFDDASRDFSHHGFSDTWVGLRYQLRRGRTPMVLEVNARLPYLYEDGERWLGLLKHDFSGLVFAERATEHGTVGIYGGYTVRQGAPADQLRLGLQWQLPGMAMLPFEIRVGVDSFISVGGPSASEPSDRFGQRDRTADSVNYFTFNESSWARPWVVAYRPLGVGGLGLDVGYGRIGFAGLGRSVHLYNELYMGVSRSF